MRRDTVTWRQIGVGYAVLACIGLGTAEAVLEQRMPELDTFRPLVGFTALVLLCGLWLVTAPLLRRASRWLGPTADGQLRLKQTAVAAMLLVSFLLCAALIFVTRLLNPW